MAGTFANKRFSLCAISWDFVRNTETLWVFSSGVLYNILEYYSNQFKGARFNFSASTKVYVVLLILPDLLDEKYTRTAWDFGVLDLLLRFVL